LQTGTPDSAEGSLTLADLREQVRALKAAKGFDISLEQRLAYLTSEVGEVAAEVLRLSRDGNEDAGRMGAAEVAAVRERLGMEIYDVLWNLLDLAELAGVEDLEAIFHKKAAVNGERVWVRAGGSA
jgi:NTP pyrophosphatase (non-canonical NTP hydrolase)